MYLMSFRTMLECRSKNIHVLKQVANKKLHVKQAENDWQMAFSVC